MKTRVQVFPLSYFVCLLCFFAANDSASAAPPTITHLYPAGAQRGTTTEINAAGTFDTWPAKMWVSGKGVSVVAAKDKGKFTVTVDKDAEPGTYWLRAHNDDGASGLRPFIVGMLPEIAEQEPNDEYKKPQVLSSTSVVINGKLQKAGDVDCYALNLKDGQTVVAALEANWTLKSPMDAVVQALTDEGFVHTENHDYKGLDPQVMLTASRNGTYLVRIFAFPSMPDSSIRFFGSEACVYRLTLTTQGFAEYARPMAVSRLGPPTVKLIGWNIPDINRTPRVRIPADAKDSFTLIGDDVVLTPARLLIEPHECFDALAPRDPNKPRGPYQPPVTIGGQLEEAIVPFRHPVAGKKGTTYDITVRGGSLGVSTTPVVRITTLRGTKELAKAEPAKLHGDTTLSFTAATDETFSVDIADLYGKHGLRYPYLLRIVPAEPDYELTLATGRFTVVPGKPTSIPVKVTRRHGFTKPVEIEAEGLPAGVKLEVVAPPKPDPTTITVNLTADKPASGTFRLVGKVKDEPKLARIAKATLTEFEESTADLWVTVPATMPSKK